MLLTISIVTYRSDPILFIGALQSLVRAVEYAQNKYKALKCSLIVIENDYQGQNNLRQAEEFLRDHCSGIFEDLSVSSVGRNLGYGKGHNLALEYSQSDFSLVLNPDVMLNEDAIYQGLHYMNVNQGVVLVSPSGVDGNDLQLSLCKRYPAIFDLFLRGFGPKWLKRRFRKRLARYEMHDLLSSAEPVSGVDIVSGCCMLMSTSALRQVEGFDRDYFLYFEDFDLSLRIGKIGDIVYFPAMKIVHHGGYAARKGIWHIMLFASSALKFYRRHKWLWF